MDLFIQFVQLEHIMKPSLEIIMFQNGTLKFIIAQL